MNDDTQSFRTGAPFITLIALLALALATSPASAAAGAEPQDDVLSAAEAGDFEPLFLALTADRDPKMKALLRAREAASRLDATATNQALEEVSAADDVRARVAWEVLTEVSFATGNYLAAAQAAWKLREKLLGGGEPARLAGVTQTFEISSALATEPAQSVLAQDFETPSPTWPDKVGLTRTRVTIDGVTQEVVLDTGANLSVVTQSVAKNLGLRMLAGTSAVRSSTSDAVSARLAIARRVVIAGSELSNVAFLVLDDEALSMPVPGGYRIEAIIGFPVFRALGRVRFGTRQMTVERIEVATPRHAPNLRAIGSNLVVQARIAGIAVPLHLDSGANTSQLSARFARRWPERMTDLPRATANVAGAGGVRLQVEHAVWKSVVVELGGRSLELPELTIDTRDTGVLDNFFGVLGKDILGAFESFTLDFHAMSFELGPPLAEVRPARQ